MIKYVVILFLLYTVTTIGQVHYIEQATEDLAEKSTAFKKLEAQYNRALDDDYVFLRNNDIQGKLERLRALDVLKEKVKKSQEALQISTAYLAQNNVSQDLLLSLVPFNLDLSDLKLPNPNPSQASGLFTNRKNWISNTSFTKEIAQDFSYPILKEDAPQEGIRATLNAKVSSIKQNGVLHRNSHNILTLEADVTATNDVYFLDQQLDQEKEDIFGGNTLISYNYPLKDSYKPTSWHRFIPKQFFC